MRTLEAPWIRLAQVSKVFQQGAQTIRAVDQVSLDVAPGEFLAITGASGSGKSTLLHLIAGLETPTSGTVSLGGVALGYGRCATVDLTPAHYWIRVSIFNLLPALTAQENAALPLLLAGHPARQAAERAAQLLTWVQLEQRLLSRPSELGR